MHTCYRWMRPCRATRAGTQAPPLPSSIKSLCHATSLILVHRRAPLPRNLPHLSPSASPSPAPFFRFSPSASTSPATCSRFSPSASTSPATFSCFVRRRAPRRQPSLVLSVGRASSGNLLSFCPSAEPLPATFFRFCPSAEALPATFFRFCPSAEPLPATAIRNEGRFAATPK